MAGIEIIDTLSDMGDTVKDIVGEKGLTLLIIGGIGFLAYSAIKKNGTFSMPNDGDERSVVAIASYPDVGENANVVIDTLQDSILYSEMNMTDVMGTNFEATNDYINDASNSIKGKIDDQSEMIEDNFSKTFYSHRKSCLSMISCSRSFYYSFTAILLFSVVFPTLTLYLISR